MSTARVVAAASSRSAPGFIKIDEALFKANFAKRPFRIEHNLADHPLFRLPRLIQLACALPAKHVEYNAGNIPVNLAPEKTPRTGLSIDETIHRIEECQSWMVLKNVEIDPEYKTLLDACLAEVFAHTIDCREHALREAFVFISSPGSVTPYHMDPELNFLLQIHGTKQVHVFPGSDRSLLSEQELEKFYSGAHRNLVFRNEYQHKAVTFDLRPGDGVHVPVTHPHWVKVGEAGYAISFSITFQTRECDRRAALYSINYGLRQQGHNPTSVGQSWWRDTVIYTKHRVRRRMRRLLRVREQSE